MTKVKILLRVEEKFDRYSGWPGIERVYVEGRLINVFWHPIDGPMGAVLTEYDEIETFKLDTIEVVSE